MWLPGHESERLGWVVGSRHCNDMPTQQQQYKYLFLLLYVLFLGLRILQQEMATMSFVSVVSSAFALLSIVPNVVAAPSPSAKAACSVLEQQYPKQYADSSIEISNLALGVTYTEQLHAYWSQANADNKPACMFFPKTAQDIAYAVQVLNNFTSVPWAVKGGGHNPNVGYSSTKGGVLIATEPNMATTTLDSQNYAHIGPGSRWIDVATALDPYNRAVVSGRLGHVGVAGLTLGGGLSFLSTEHVRIVPRHVVSNT